MAPKTRPQTAAWCGFDLSTTGLAVGVRSSAGKEAYVSTPVSGVTRWHGQPAFHLEHVPKMILELLETLGANGWNFKRTSLSFAVRQHDMVLLDKKGDVLMPALSWQCNAATEQVDRLRNQGAEDVVGRVEERFILPKLLWALNTEPSMRRGVAQVTTTGDWIAQLLTGKARLSTSDAISNGLLVQRTKKIADNVMRRAKLNSKWFPKVIQSGRSVGRVTKRSVAGADSSWMRVKEILSGAQVIAGLGDNHATGVGCGLQEKDYGSIVVSAGTSGTINRVCARDVSLAGNAACFEYYQDRMLLMMLADCCSWYDRFVLEDANRYKSHLDRLNSLAEKADTDNVRRVLSGGADADYPPNWTSMSPGERAASTQFSIMFELLVLVREMINEAPSGDAISRFVLTGGLSQSKFFQQVFSAGIRTLAPRAKVEISARRGPLRFQTAAYGALLNAMRPKDPKAAARLCKTKPAARPAAKDRAALQYLLRAHGL